jgi:multiple sugar transport system ATP-binding protein
MVAIEFNQVTKIYPGGVPALREVDLRVNAGELMVLMGPSGCGKTTALRLIAGLEAPTSGTIRLGGRPANHLPARDRDVAMVFQRPALYPHLNVRRNLAFGLQMRQRPGWFRRLLVPWEWRSLAAEVRRQARERADRVTAAARLLGLESLQDRFPQELSGGQQQRVALGRAVVRRPAAFLLDEPLCNLETSLRTEMRGELHLLHRRLQATMIYVTHDPVEAMALADRLVVLREGAVQQIGRPLEVYRWPCNRFVAAFLGWPPMNLIDGRLTRTADGGLQLTAPGGSLHLPSTAPAGWSAHVGCAVTMGIRPEDVSCGLPLGGLSAGSGGLQPSASFMMEVSVVEPLGGSCLVTLQRGEWRVVGQVTGTAGLTCGQYVEVGFNMNRAHLFDAGSGVALPEAARPDG